MRTLLRRLGASLLSIAAIMLGAYGGYQRAVRSVAYTATAHYAPHQEDSVDKGPSLEAIERTARIETALRHRSVPTLFLSENGYTPHILTVNKGVTVYILNAGTRPLHPRIPDSLCKEGGLPITDKLLQPGEYMTCKTPGTACTRYSIRDVIYPNLGATIRCGQ